MVLEIACFNLKSAVIAQDAGADRIELCEDYASGGVTPSYNTILKVRRLITIPLFLMIRPRKGNYIYNSGEIKEMKKQIHFSKESGIDGVVFGILDLHGNIDKLRCAELVTLAHPISATFHRAFDEVKHPLTAMEDIVECGFKRILTSGQKKTALEGVDMLSFLIKKANDQVIILPGGAIRSNNITEIKEKTSAREFHSAALNTATMLPDENEIRKLKSLI